jgi:hypothetical protein
MFKTSRIEGRVSEWVIPISKALLTVMVTDNKQIKEKHGEQRKMEFLKKTRNQS